MVRLGVGDGIECDGEMSPRVGRDWITRKTIPARVTVAGPEIPIARVIIVGHGAVGGDAGGRRSLRN